MQTGPGRQNPGGSVGAAHSREPVQKVNVEPGFLLSVFFGVGVGIAIGVDTDSDTDTDSDSDCDCDFVRGCEPLLQ